MAYEGLDYITIQGFKSIRSNEKLALRHINILIGPNGSGKSNFLGTFSFLHAVREGRLQNYVTEAGGAEKILHFGSKTTKRIKIDVSFCGEINQYSLTLLPSNDDSLFPDGEVASFWSKPQHKHPYTEGLPPLSNGREAGISGASLSRIQVWVRTRLGSWRRYHVHDTSSSSPMRKTTNTNDNNFLRPDGSNLAAFLYFLYKKHPESYSMIRRTIQRVAPFFDDFNLAPLALNPDSIKLEWKHKNSD